MIDVNGLLIGFVAGLFAGIFLAYKISQVITKKNQEQQKPKSRQWTGIKTTEKGKKVQEIYDESGTLIGHREL